ncbi:MAG: hypothetical protein NVS3B5_19710 [Sphingomicrobium sp.]|jgi:uncharacterized membrane protein YkoI
MKKSLLAIAAALSLVPIGYAIAAPKPTPKITMAAARSHALKLAPGRVISAEYENEGGGWRYSFDIQQNHNVQEIGIDAMTGKVVENKSEGVRDKD